MALWPYLHTPQWRVLLHRRSSQRSTPTATPKSTSVSTASVTTVQPSTPPSTATTSPISSESVPSSSSSSSSSDHPSVLPFSSTSLLALAPSSPPSSPPSSGPQHIMFAAPGTPIAGQIVFSLADRIAASCRKVLSQHKYLGTPLRQLLHACRPSSGSLDGPYPALDVADVLAGVHTTLLGGLLELEVKLRVMEGALCQVDSVETLMLVRIEKEIEEVADLIRSLRRLEEGVKRFLRAEAGRVGGRGDVMKKVRDEFSPGMRDAICDMNLLGARIQFVNLQLVQEIGRSRVPRKQVYEN